MWAVSEGTAVLMRHDETVLRRSPKFELWPSALSDKEHRFEIQETNHGCWMPSIGCSIRGSRGSVAFLCKHRMIYIYIIIYIYI